MTGKPSRLRRRRVLAPVRVAVILLASMLPALVGAAARAEPVAVSFPGPDGTTLDGRLYRPAGSDPFPAVVALHGCGGLFDRTGAPSARHADWGERLAAQGFMVLFPDSFGSRGLGPQCRVARRTVRPGRERVADARATGAWLRGRPDVKAGAVSLLGWSNGGSTVLAAVRAGNGSFDRAVAFYPGCRAPLEHGWRDGTPLLILVGGDDDWTGAEPCRALAEAARARGEPVEITVYPGAVHDFDAPGLPVRRRRNLAYTVDRGGIAHAGTDPAARADALSRVPAYLAR